ncbi:MAG: SURF1 family protein [Methylococcaceae bacterium]
MTKLFKKITWPALIFFVLVLSLLISLGFWQLGRAEQKRAFLLQQQQLLTAGEVLLNANAADDISLWQYRPVRVTGHYAGERQFLIDNQHVKGKVGYFVLTPLRIEGSDKAILVNRGWVPLNVDRSILPALPVNSDTVTVTGRINHFPSVGVKLAGAEIPTATWPSVVQVVDASVLAGKLGFSLFSFQIELDPDKPDGYLRDWQSITIMPPEKHIAYAVQWFGLALTFSLLFFWLTYKKTS